jgi:hypothetical protein
MNGEAAEPDYVTVRIKASQTVFYNRVVQVSKKEWAALKAKKENDICKPFNGDLSQMLDDEPDSARPFDLEEMIVVDEDTELPVEPADEYRGY